MKAWASRAAAPRSASAATRARRSSSSQGDVVVLPAGTGHQCLWASPDLMVIGTYPKTGKYDLCRGSKGEHAKALETIPHVPLPDSDPVYGKQGPLLRLWHAEQASSCPRANFASDAVAPRIARLDRILGHQALDLRQCPPRGRAFPPHRRGHPRLCAGARRDARLRLRRGAVGGPRGRAGVAA